MNKPASEPVDVEGIQAILRRHAQRAERGEKTSFITLESILTEAADDTDTLAAENKRLVEELTEANADVVDKIEHAQALQLRVDQQYWKPKLEAKDKQLTALQDGKAVIMGDIEVVEPDGDNYKTALGVVLEFPDKESVRAFLAALQTKGEG